MHGSTTVCRLKRWRSLRDALSLLALRNSSHPDLSAEWTDDTEHRDFQDEPT
jgi:hypothetical protein